MQNARVVTCLLIMAVLVLPAVAGAQVTAKSSSGWVVLPIDEYDRLHEKAYPTEPEAPSPPVEATLTRVDYDLRVVGDISSGRASLTIDVLKDGWARVPVPSGMLIREARLNGKLVSLVGGIGKTDRNVLYALLPHVGRSVLILDVVFPVSSNAGDSSLSLPSTNSGVTKATLHIPRQGLDVTVSGGLLTEKSDGTPEAKWVAFGRGNTPLGFGWRRRLDDHRSEQPLRMRGAMSQLVSLGEDSSSIYAEVNVDIQQGAAQQATLQLPDKVAINQVQGANVADWEIKGDTLTVTFLEPVEKSARFVISGDARLAREGQIDIPILKLLNAERATGGVAVEVLGAGEIRESKATGMEEAAASDLGESIAVRQSPSLIAFRSRNGNGNRALRVDVARYAQQAVLMANVEEARYQVLMSNDGKNLVRARYAVRNNQRNFLKIMLPQASTVWSTSLAGKPIRPGQSPDGGILLPLEKSKGGEEAPAFAVEVVYIARSAIWDEKGKNKITLPALDLPISRTGMLLYHPPLYRVTSDPGTFRTQTYEPPTSAAFNVEGAVAAAETATNGRDVKKLETQSLLDSLKSKYQGKKAAGIIPINVQFPAFGPSIFLISELTSENQAPAVELTYQREKKRGVQ